MIVGRQAEGSRPSVLAVDIPPTDSLHLRRLPGEARQIVGKQYRMHRLAFYRIIAFYSSLFDISDAPSCTALVTFSFPVHGGIAGGFAASLEHSIGPSNF